MRLSIAVITLLAACLGLFSQNLHTGDIVFQLASGSEFSKAISSATSESGMLDFSHVGIIEIDSNGNIFVIEASPGRGVCITALDDFILNSPEIGSRPGLLVKRLIGDYPLSDIVSRAKKHLGEEYDWYYLPDNGRMYCSELIYDSYIDCDGRHIFDARPMNFKAPDGTFPPFWIQLFEKIGRDIPQGMPGTNPNDLSKSPRLVEIYRFF